MDNNYVPKHNKVSEVTRKFILISGWVIAACSAVFVALMIGCMFSVPDDDVAFMFIAIIGSVLLLLGILLIVMGNTYYDKRWHTPGYVLIKQKLDSSERFKNNAIGIMAVIATIVYFLVIGIVFVLKVVGALLKSV